MSEPTVVGCILRHIWDHNSSCQFRWPFSLIIWVSGTYRFSLFPFQTKRSPIVLHSKLPWRMRKFGLVWWANRASIFWQFVNLILAALDPCFIFLMAGGPGYMFLIIVVGASVCDKFWFVLCVSDVWCTETEKSSEWLPWSGLHRLRWTQALRPSDAYMPR